MKSYGKYILNKLLDKYEKSKNYGQPEKMTRGIFFYFRKKYLADYFIDRTSEYKLRINADCQQLEKKGFISISWVKFEEGNLIDKVRLNLERVAEIYEYLGREALLDKEERLLEVINNYRQDNPDWLRSFYNYIIQKVQQHANPVYLEPDRPELAGQVCTVLNAIAALQEETPIRLFSLKHLGDSKLFYKLQNRIVRILRDFYSQLDGELPDSELLAEVGLIPNPDYLYLSGPLEFSYRGSLIRVNDFDPDLGLPIKMLQGIKITNLEADYIMTIENLTPYHEYIRNNMVLKNNKNYLNNNKNHFKSNDRKHLKSNQKKGLIIYLGGFHNRWRREIMVALKEYVDRNKLSIPFYHWGDIDYGGFMILKHLRETTDINFQPYRMDVRTLEEYKKYCQPISDQDYLNRLEKLIDEVELKDIKSTVQYMIGSKLRLEQEALLIEKD